MKSKLQQFYPSLREVEHDQIPEGYLPFQDGDSFFAIKEDELSEKDILLLNALFRHEKQTPWMKYLMRDEAIEDKNKEFTIIQIKLKGNKEEADLWMETFLYFFDEVEDSFFYKDKIHLLVVESSQLLELDLAGIVQTLEQDLGILSSLYIGSSKKVTEGLKESFVEDHNIFSHVEEKQAVNDYRLLYLQYYMREQVDKSYQLSLLREKIHNIKEAYELVMTLWLNQGNISQTAQSLYIHRNTLNYRLDKFEEETGLSLRNLSDLQLSYFSIV